jgi:sugar porter (SP) family MFS transporter
MTRPTDAGSDKSGVLAALDAAAATSFYWYLALLACIGGFLFGYDTAVIGSVLDFIPYQLSDLAKGYLAGGASLGAAVGALAAGPLTDRFGRKSLLIADAAIYALGAILSAVAVNAFMLLSSRTLIGLAVGADSALATAYIVEFAPARRRGSLAILQQWMITVGILVSYLVALLTLKIAPQAAGGADWRIILGLGALPALVAIALRSRMPESPRWLLQMGRLTDARQALGQLGVQASAEQVRDTAAQIADTDRDHQQVSRWTRGVKRALILVCVFFVFQQITGINVPFYYGPQLLGHLFQSGSNPVDAAVAGIAAAAVLGAVNVIATFFAFRYIDRVGRRKLAIGGYAGMAVFILVTAAGVAFLMGPAQIMVVIVGFSFFITSFAIGVGGTGWLIQGEVFPTAIRGRAAAIGASVDWVANFAIILLFPALTTAFGLPVLMVLLAVLAVLAIGFVTRYMPETKNLSLDEVIDTFDQQAATTHHATTQ